MRVLVYSHDTFGLGNIRRMLAIATHLKDAIADTSILIVSGSPMLHSFRVQPGIDYIKLPVLKRTENGDLGVRFLDLELEQVRTLRRELILSTVVAFRPDVVLVDKKPEGLAGELEPGLRYIRCNLPETRVILVLRDILDAPEVTAAQWRERGYQDTVRWYYDQVLVLGERRIFDICAEYRLSADVCRKVRFCGYVARELPRRPRAEVRAELGVADDQALVVVTTGGGEDGYEVISTYLDAVPELGARSLVIMGPELSPAQARNLLNQARELPGVRMLEFTDDLISYLNAADVVVSMAGYNTVGELLTLRKRAVLVPRVKPVQEQKIRAERLAALAAFRMVSPDALDARVLARVVRDELRAARAGERLTARVDLGALPRIAELVAGGAPALRPPVRAGSPWQRMPAAAVAGAR